MQKNEFLEMPINHTNHKNQSSDNIVLLVPPVPFVRKKNRLLKNILDFLDYVIGCDECVIVGVAIVKPMVKNFAPQASPARGAIVTSKVLPLVGVDEKEIKF
ncbi:MAG: hypothetical protein LBP59_19040 [Planctomycetaceae bacterium]|nr:hypothetical protein [Planctomycetaceae bacterium]